MLLVASSLELDSPEELESDADRACHGATHKGV
jgi:hypothetical protein